MKQLRPLVLALGLSASLSAHAALWDFSYTFESGDVISGEFKGVQKGDFIENIRDISAAFNDTPFIANPLIDAFGYNIDTNLFDASIQPRVSPTLSLNNFIFVNTHELGFLNNDPINDFRIINDPTLPSTDASPHVEARIRLTGNPTSAFDVPGLQDRWVLTKAHGNHVPEPSTLLLLAPALLLFRNPRASRPATGQALGT